MIQAAPRKYCLDRLKVSQPVVCLTVRYIGCRSADSSTWFVQDKSARRAEKNHLVRTGQKCTQSGKKITVDRNITCKYPVEEMADCFEFATLDFLNFQFGILYGINTFYTSTIFPSLVHSRRRGLGISLEFDTRAIFS